MIRSVSWLVVLRREAVDSKKVFMEPNSIRDFLPVYVTDVTKKNRKQVKNKKEEKKKWIALSAPSADLLSALCG